MPICTRNPVVNGTNINCSDIIQIVKQYVSALRRLRLSDDAACTHLPRAAVCDNTELPNIARIVTLRYLNIADNADKAAANRSTVKFTPNQIIRLCIFGECSANFDFACVVAINNRRSSAC